MAAPYPNQRAPTPSIDTAKIRFSKPLDAEIFNVVAKEAAETISQSDTNKPTQLRRFYDELVMWNEKVTAEPAKFGDYLPFIKMLNAKVAYAEGRKHVDGNFKKLMAACLNQVKDAETLNHCKLFMEAFMGFYKGLKG